MVLLDLQAMESASAAENGPGFGPSDEPTSDLSILICHGG
ncbi:SapB/AmfS family lanthipeptide [Streptomyces abikoensis]